MEGQRFSKIMQTTRILALGAALTLCALATGSLGFKIYTHLLEVRQIDANLSDRHLHKLSLDYERLHFTYSQNSNGHLLDKIQSDIIETINKVQSHAVIQDKILQAQVTLLLDEASQTLSRLPSGEARFEPDDDLSDTLLIQTEKLRDLSAGMSNYLADLRMMRQLELTKTLNQLIISTACALVAVIIGAAMFLRNHLQSEKRAQDGQRAALQSETILSTTLDAVVVAEAELVKARDKALKSEQAKADFLAIMSHEMRTPLNRLTGAIELLETTGLTTSQSKYLNTLRQSASELQHHVNDVLDIAHLSATLLTML